MLYTIIVPIYNAEKYLADCVESILAQSFTNFELLLIDDGSKDRSWEICKLYSEKDNRVRIFHKENAGVSSARNLGLDEAKGKWITFCDSDDWVEKDWLLQTTKIINENNPDIIRFGYIKEEKYKQKIIISDNNYQIYNVSEMLKYNTKYEYYGYLWNTIYRQSILKNVRFDETLSLGEDHLFTNEALLNARLMYMSQSYFYHYMIRDRVTLSTNLDPYLVINSAEKLLLVEKRMIETNDFYYTRPMRVYHQNIKAALILLYTNGSNWNERYEFYKRLKIIEFNYISFVEKIYINKYIPFILKDAALLFRFWLKRI